MEAVVPVALVSMSTGLVLLSDCRQKWKDSVIHCHIKKGVDDSRTRMVMMVDVMIV